MIETRGALARDTVALFKALGGGWPEWSGAMNRARPIIVVVAADRPLPCSPGTCSPALTGARTLSGYIEGENLFLAAPVAGTVSPSRRSKAAGGGRRSSCSPSIPRPCPPRASRREAQVSWTRAPRSRQPQANAQQAEAEAWPLPAEAERARARLEAAAVGAPRRSGRGRRQGHRRRPGRAARGQCQS